jgi:hypothetical protein
MGRDLIFAYQARFPSSNDLLNHCRRTFSFLSFSLSQEEGGLGTASKQECGKQIAEIAFPTMLGMRGYLRV